MAKPRLDGNTIPKIRAADNMPWTKSDYPPEMKYLPQEIRYKAIQIANALIKETKMMEGSAVYAAIKRARQLSTKGELSRDNGLKQRGTNSKGNIRKRFVIFYDGGWALRVEGSTKVQEFFRTKKQAIEQARREAFLVGAPLTIFKKDGTMEKEIRSNKIAPGGGKRVKTKGAGSKDSRKTSEKKIASR